MEKAALQEFSWLFPGLRKGSTNPACLSAEQLHVLLHPTKENEDESLRKSEEIVSKFAFLKFVWTCTTGYLILKRPF